MQRRHASEAPGDVTARSLARPLMTDSCQSRRVGGVMPPGAGNRRHFCSRTASLAFDLSHARRGYIEKPNITAYKR